MAKFIPIEKMSKLREAAKTGDANAIKILDLQMSGGDFGELLDNYFQPKPAVEEQKSLPEKGGQSNLEKFLAFNSVTKDSPDYDSFVEDFYKEFPNERPHEHKEIQEEPEEGFEEWIRKLINEESDAIDSYSKAITKVMNCEALNESKKRRVIARLKEIRSDEEEHFRELGELLKNDESEGEML